MRKSTVIILLALALASCGRTTHVQNLFNDAEAQMYTTPDSALRILRSIDPEQLSWRSLRARYALLYSQALDKNGVDLQNDSIITPAVAYYTNHGGAREKALMNYYRGRIHDNVGEVGEAANRMLEAEKFAIPSGQTGLLGLIYNCLGNLYYAQYSLMEALEMYDKADSCFALEGKTSFSAFMAKAKTKVHILMKDHGAALREHQRAIAIFDSLGNRRQLSLMRSSFAYLLLEHKQISADSVKRFLTTTYTKYTGGVKPVADYPLWAWIYLKEKQIDSAQYYAHQAYKLQWNTQSRQSGMLSIICQAAAAAGNYRQAVELMTKAYNVLDSVSHYEKLNLIQRIGERYENKELQYRNEVLRLRGKLFLAVSGLILTILIAVFVLTRRHWKRLIRRKSEENAQYRQFIDRLNDDHSSLKSRYDQLTGEIGGTVQEAGMLKAIEKRLNDLQQLLDLAYSGVCKPHKFYQEFKKYAAEMNNDEFAFSDLQYVINKRYHGMIDYLRREYPSLTSSELTMLCMMLFGFSFDCIRLIFNHDNVDSIYSRRTKIRDKMQLPPRTKLEKYLADLAEELRQGKTPQKPLQDW